MAEERQTIELIYAYAQSDEEQWKKLDTHLNNLGQRQDITAWDQQKVFPSRQCVRDAEACLSTIQFILLGNIISTQEDKHTI